MGLFDSTVVTAVEKPFIYFTERGRLQTMKNRHSYCLAFCQTGQVTYTQNGIEHTLTPGHAVLLPQGGCYTIRGDKYSVVPAINFTGTGLACDTITVFELSDPSKLLSLCKRLSELFVLPDKRLSIFSIFYDMLRQVSTDDAMNHTPLRSLLDYIEQRIDDPALSNTLLAEKLGVSEVYLRRLFTTYCGITPKQYILDLRVEKAKQLLSDHLYNVSEVAEKCGFSSVYRFCRVFKQRTNTTPSEYAAQHIVYEI